MQRRNVRDEFLEEVEEFLEDADMFPTKFGTLALNDSRFVVRLREEGSDVKASTIDRCRVFMQQYRDRHL